MSPIDPRMQAWQEHVIDAALAAGGVARIVKLSGSTWTQDPASPTASGTAHAAVEARLAQARADHGLHVAIVRPGVFTDGFLQVGLARLAASADATGLVLPMADAAVAFADPDTIAAVCVRALLADPDPTDPGQADAPIEVSFPDAVDGPTLAAQAARILGRDVRYVPADVAHVLAARADRTSAFERLHAGQMLGGITAGRAARPAEPPLPELAGDAWPNCLARLLAVPTELR